MNRYTMGSGWGTAEIIDTGDVRHASVAIDAAGTAVVVYPVRVDATHTSIRFARNVKGENWSTPAPIDDPQAGRVLRDAQARSCDADCPQATSVAVDSGGAAFAAWVQHPTQAETASRLFVNRYDPASGWGIPVALETADSGDVSLPRIAVDEQGRALVIFRQHDGTRENLWASRFE